MTTISNNVAYSSVTHRLYVLGDNAGQLFSYDASAIVSGTAPQLYACELDDAILSSGQATGAPAIIGGSPERVLVADSGEHRLWAFAKSGTSATCASPVTTNDTGNWNGNVNPPVTDGTNIFLGHDNTNLSKVPFSGGQFQAAINATAFTVPVFGPVSIAGSLFFGDSNAVSHLYDYSLALSTNWAAAAASVGGGLNAPVVVDSSYAYSFSTSGEGHLHAFLKGDGTAAFQWPTTGAKLRNISAAGFGADGAIYFLDDGNTKLVALKVSNTPTPNTPATAANWTSTFKGAITTPISTAVDSLGTEPTIDANGVLYFGTGGGKVYAIITDSGGPLAPSAGSTWPRVGYDNCNSSNTAFTCQ